MGVMLLAALLLAITCNAIDVSVETPLGTVVGKAALGGRAAMFLNVRYATAARFRPPVPVAPWSTPLKAQHFGPGCPQACGTDPELRYSCPASISEDCLHVNIYTPAMNRSLSGLSVLVFLPGGNFRNEGADSILKDSSRFASAHNLVVVVVNSRLGALGWLIHESVRPNLGLEDQREALRFVRDNIASFGGDPQKVTLFGQSSGATSIAAHLVSAESEGLFHAAISESNPITLPLKNAQIGGAFGAHYFETIGCAVGNVTCLEQQSVEAILEAQRKVFAYQVPGHSPLYAFYPWTPLVDRQPLELILAGKAMKIPVLFGTVSNEAINYALSFPGLDVDTYTMLMIGIFGPANAKRVLARYPPVEGSVTQLLGRVATEYLFTCSSWAAARAMKGNFYHYEHSRLCGAGVEHQLRTVL